MLYFPFLNSLDYLLRGLSPNDCHMKNSPYGTEKSSTKAITAGQATQRPSQEEDGREDTCKRPNTVEK